MHYARLHISFNGDSPNCILLVEINTFRVHMEIELSRLVVNHISV